MKLESVELTSANLKAMPATAVAGVIVGSEAAGLKMEQRGMQDVGSEGQERTLRRS